ncbi:MULTISPECIES: peptidylprolyl isomerase [Sphingobium]|uniref:peptidylprolyl isomerase n=2 Tax=Sphingobium TaxID=165695 RepID=D4Z5V2_SPHIU|nr:peptidyl-prolyl cis-trans isomerase [Sphingobium indicum UT26S]
MLYFPFHPMLDRAMPIRSLAFTAALFLSSPALAADAPATPSAIVAQAPAGAWRPIAPDALLVMTVEGGKRVVIQLAPDFAPAHVANIRALARAGWWDGESVYRVQDNYVAQWGDATEKKALPPGIAANIVPDYVRPLATLKGAAVPLPYPDAYAPRTGFIDGWPVAMDETSAWLPHCYAMVGVARNLSPDAGTGAELYAVIGQAPRQLDRNIALVGRVIEGIGLLASLPRGSGDLGFYAAGERRLPILSVRLASDLPEAQRPRYQAMDVGSRSFADYLRLRANRKDDFYERPAGGVDLCNAPVPVRQAP